MDMTVVKKLLIALGANVILILALLKKHSNLKDGLDDLLAFLPEGSKVIDDECRTSFKVGQPSRIHLILPNGDLVEAQGEYSFNKRSFFSHMPALRVVDRGDGSLLIFVRSNTGIVEFNNPCLVGFEPPRVGDLIILRWQNCVQTPP